MKAHILVIDDEQLQTEGLVKALRQEDPNYFVENAWQEAEILQKIEDVYYNIAIVDIRMEKYKFDGLEIAKRIIAINPLAQIILVSAYLPSYESNIKEIYQTGRVIGTVQKSSPDAFVAEILQVIRQHQANLENNPNIMQSAWEDLYADAKNETNAYQKGLKFEKFVAMLFQNMGFKDIKKRIKDQSSSEIDLSIRNEIADNFFGKFKPYFFVECKNTVDTIDKNQTATFFRKLENSNGLANLGFFATTNFFTSEAKKDAMRDSSKNCKVVFLDQPAILEIVKSQNFLDTLKNIIDTQVKDN